MKKIALFALALYYVVAISSCKKDCGPDITRPALSADALQWVEVANKNPKFKITTYDSQGTKVDTVQGTYTLTTEKKSELVDDCYYIHYNKYINNLFVLYDKGSYGSEFQFDNYPENDFRGSILPYQHFLSNKTILDTALVNGKIYYDVFKLSIQDFKYYYAKGVGIIYKKTSVTLELIP